MGLFEIDNLTFAYNVPELIAVSGLSLCVCGKSGC